MASAIFYGTEYTRNRSDLVAGAEAQRRLLQRQGRGPAPAARRDTSRYDRAVEASDAAIRQLEHEIKLETARLADHRAAEAARRRLPRRPRSVDVSTAAAPADDASCDHWCWEGPAREAALHALDVSRREALVKDWREARGRKRVIQRIFSVSVPRARVPEPASSALRAMIVRPKISRNEWKTAERGAFEVGNFALFSCPGEASARKVREDAEYREATTERNSLFEALGWVELEDRRAAASAALAAEVRAVQLENGVQARRDAETQRHWKVVRDVFDVTNAVGA